MFKSTRISISYPGASKNPNLITIVNLTKAPSDNELSKRIYVANIGARFCDNWTRTVCSKPLFLSFLLKPILHGNSRFLQNLWHLSYTRLAFICMKLVIMVVYKNNWINPFSAWRNPNLLKWRLSLQQFVPIWICCQYILGQFFL